MKMNLNEYQEKAMSFRLPSADYVYAIVNLSAEVGELQSIFSKAWRDKAIIDVLAFQKELGDVLWHVAAIAKDYGWSLEDVAATNLSKLTDRLQRGAIQGSGNNR